MRHVENIIGAMLALALTALPLVAIAHHLF